MELSWSEERKGQVLDKLFVVIVLTYNIYHTKLSITCSIKMGESLSYRYMKNMYKNCINISIRNDKEILYFLHVIILKHWEF